MAVQRPRRTAVVAALGLAAATLAFTSAPTAAHAAQQIGAAEPVLLAPYDHYGIVPDPGGVAIGDVTGDDLPDLVATSRYERGPQGFALWIFPQRANGRLGEPERLSTSGRNYTNMPPGVGDVDGDGDDDVVVGTNNGLDLFLQGEDGLAAPVAVGGPGYASDLAVADLDGDGDAEMVVGSNGRFQVVDGDGSEFTPGFVGVGGPQVEVGDVTGDGRLDIVSAGEDGIRVYAQAPDGSFADESVLYDTDGAVSGLAVGDISGDGAADLVYSRGGNGPSAQLVVRLQDESGTLAEPITHPSYDIPQSLAIADLSGDGQGDVVVAHGGWSAVGIYVSTPDGLRAEQLVEVPGRSHYAIPAIAIGDLSNDGSPDIALADAGIVVVRTRLPYADLDLSVDRGELKYGEAVRATVRLADTTDRAVRLIAVSEGRRRVVATGDVDERGIFTTRVSLTRTSRLIAEFAGDGTHAPTRATQRVTVAARLTPKAANTYRRAGRYHLVHAADEPLLWVRLQAPAAGQCLRFAAQAEVGSRWRRTASKRCVRTDARGRAGLRLTGVPVGTDLRMRASFGGSELNAAATTKWVYFRITR